MFILTLTKNIVREFLSFLESIIVWCPGRTGYWLRKLAYSFLFKKCGVSLRLEPFVTIRGCSNISIGNNCTIMQNSSLYVVNSVLEIGENFSMNQNSVLGADMGSIHIGNNVLIAQNVVLRAADHCHQSIDIPIMKQGHIRGKIVIEDGAWICANCVITKDVIIGRDSIVAAGSIVTKNVPPLTIVGGVPAKVIKKRVNQSLPGNIGKAL